MLYIYLHLKKQILVKLWANEVFKLNLNVYFSYISRQVGIEQFGGMEIKPPAV